MDQQAEEVIQSLLRAVESNDIERTRTILQANEGLVNQQLDKVSCTLESLRCFTVSIPLTLIKATNVFLRPADFRLHEHTTGNDTRQLSRCTGGATLRPNITCPR
jgi:hypothetical protein